MSDPVFPLSEFPVHLGLGARIDRLERFTGTPDWYERYGASTAPDGDEGRLVTIHTFSEPWDTWEMHPHGAELVLCVDGSIVLHQNLGEDRVTVELHAGDAIVNPRGTWHTADVAARCTAVFITAGAGTEIRPR